MSYNPSGCTSWLSPRHRSVTACDSYHDGVRDSRIAELHRRSMIDFVLANGENVSQNARAFRAWRPRVVRGVNRIKSTLHQLKLVRPRSRKYQYKRQMARYRKRLQPLPQWQIVVKGLKDIIHSYPPVTQQIPP